jgi:hypothetical protein
MILKKHIHAAALMTASLFASGAHAQYVSSYVQPAPLYPYVAQPQYSYPQPQYAPQPYPYVQSGPNMRRISRDRDMPRASEPSRKVSKTDPVLVEELRSKGRKKKIDNDMIVDNKDVKIDKKVVVREKPIVRKHIRVVDNPPIVVQREIDENGQVLSEQRLPTAQAQSPAPLGGVGRVIHAEAEVTILGPDRMSIRLYRKGDGRDAQAKALPSKLKKTKTTKSEKSQPET